MQIFVKSLGGVRLYFSGKGKRVKKANNCRRGGFLYFAEGILRVGCRRAAAAKRERCLPAGGDTPASNPQLHRHGQLSSNTRPLYAPRSPVCLARFHLYANGSFNVTWHFYDISPFFLLNHNFVLELNKLYIHFATLDTVQLLLQIQYKHRFIK